MTEKNKGTMPVDDVNTIIKIIDNISLFGGLEEKQVRTILDYLTCVSFAEGDIIFEQGKTASEIYIIKSGTVKIIVDFDKEPLELVEYGIGQCFGESSAIGILPHSATALATSDTRLLVLSNESLHKIFKDDPALFGRLILNIAREVCRRLHKADETILHFAEAKNYADRFK